VYEIKREKNAYYRPRSISQKYPPTVPDKNRKVSFMFTRQKSKPLSSKTEKQFADFSYLKSLIFL